jgi:hypothetical protein
MAIFNLVAKKANLNINQSAIKASDGITLLLDMDGREQLTVNNEYFLASTHIFKIFGKEKIELEAKLSIKRKSEIKKNGIGYMYFFKEYNDDVGLTFIPASIHFEVFLEDAQYEKIYNSIMNKNYINYLMLDVEGKDLTYGYAPDGSEKIWNATKENSKLTINEFNISFSSSEDIEEVVSEKERSEKVIEKLLKELGEIKFYLVVVAVAAAIQIITKFFG